MLGIERSMADMPAGALVAPESDRHATYIAVGAATGRYGRLGVAVPSMLVIGGAMAALQLVGALRFVAVGSTVL